jgi:hypothetical protein
VTEASEAVLAALGEYSMQDPANGLRRIPLPGTSVNKGIMKRPRLLFPHCIDKMNAGETGALPTVECKL